MQFFFYSLYFVRNFKGKVIFSFLPNKKFRVALTYNIKPEEEFSSANAFLTPNQINSLKFNDTYAEWDTIETINALKNALENYHEVIMIEANENAFEKLKTEKPDIVFNVAEGAFGISREAQIPAMLDMLQIPYSGSDPLTLATCLDKSRTKEILSYHKIPTPSFLLVNNIEQLQNFSLKFPVMLKPVGEGSSKGIFDSCFINNIEELFQKVEASLNDYDQPLIIEEFLPGREFTVALIGNGSETEILPVVEINLGELPSHLAPIYSFEAKWIVDTPDNPLNIFTCPAKIDSLLENKIKKIALDTFHILRCKDWSRIDIRLDAYGEPNIIEINPLPGILPNPEDNSCFPKAARAGGMNYTEMINRVLYTALRRHNLL